MLRQLCSSTGLITGAAWGTNNRIIVGSADTHLKLFQMCDPGINQLFDISLNSPILCCAFGTGNDEDMVFAGCANGSIMAIDCRDNLQYEITEPHGSSEDAAVLAIRHSSTGGASLLVYATADHRLVIANLETETEAVIHMADPASPGQHRTVVAMDVTVSGRYLVVCTTHRQVDIIDLRDPERAVYSSETALRTHTRSVCWLDESSFAVGSHDGRVALMHTGRDQKTFAFRAHRSVTPAGQSIAAPVGALAAHPNGLWFASGGGDGVVHTWDPVQKRAIARIPEGGVTLPDGVTGLSVNPAGDRLVVVTADPATGESSVQIQAV